MLGRLQALQWPKQWSLVFMRPNMLLSMTETFSPEVLLYSTWKFCLLLSTVLMERKLVALQWRSSCVLKTGPRQSAATFTLDRCVRLLWTLERALLQKLYAAMWLVVLPLQVGLALYCLMMWWCALGRLLLELP